jgi:hypothetical protein
MQASQIDSQNLSIIADSELQRVVEAWGKLPANLKVAIVSDQATWIDDVLVKVIKSTYIAAQSVQNTGGHSPK